MSQPLNTPLDANPSGPAADTEAPIAQGVAPDGTEAGKGNREAAKYRTQLREAEAKLTDATTASQTLTGKLTTLSKAFIEQLAGSDLRDAADLWRHGADPADMLTEDGLPDREKVQEATQAILAERPHLGAPRTPRPDLSQGARGFTKAGSGDPFGDALNKALRG